MLIGVVGKPNVGKSTFFRSATLAEALIGNYPFATIQPNHGTGFVKIKDIAQEQGKISNPREGYIHGKYRFVPIELIDVAGLVPGASEGKGMGNKFLDDLGAADVLIHVIDASGSTNERGESVETGSYDPIKDIKFLEKELDAWFHQIFERGWNKFARQLQLSGKPIDKSIAEHFSGLKINLEMVRSAFNKTKLSSNLTSWDDEDIKKFSAALREKSKPIVIAANKFDKSSNIILSKLKESTNSYVIPCTAEYELALREASKHKIIDYIPGSSRFETIGKPNSVQSTALNKIDEYLRKNNNTGIQDILNYSVFKILDSICIHPGGVSKLEDSQGNVLPDCFIMKNGSTAIDFAYKLHTDFGEKFIRAINVKTKKTVGKEYILKNYDIIEIIANK